MRVEPEFFDDIVRHWTDKQKKDAAVIVGRIVRYYAKKNPEIDVQDFIQTSMLAAIKCRKRYGNDILPGNLKGYVREGICRELLDDKIKMREHGVKCDHSIGDKVEFVTRDSIQDFFEGQDSISMMLYEDEISGILSAEEHYLFKKAIMQGDSVGDCFRDLNPDHTRRKMEYDFIKMKQKIASLYCG